MSYFYPEEMTYCECIMPRQIGWDVLDELGQLQKIHFENKTIQYDSPYMKNMKRCEEAIHKINQIKSFVLSIKPDFKLKPVLSYQELLGQYQREIMNKKIHGHLLMNEIEDQILNIHGYLTQQKKQLDNLKNDLNENLLDASLMVTLSASQDFKVISRQKRQASYFENSQVSFDFKSIIIDRKDEYLLEKGLFRISRGNTWVKCIQIDEANLYKIFHKEFSYLKDKIICIIMHQTGQSRILQSKINRFLSCIQCTSTNIPPDRWERALNSLQSRIKELNNLITLTNDAVERYLHKLYQPRFNSQFSYLTYLEAYTHKEYQIYRQLCCTLVSKSFLHFNIYIPSKQLPLQIQPNDKLPPLTLTPKKSPKPPPTKFDTPSIMEIPQQILNTYGVPTYGQFNPAVFYIITFGFFIGVMFGDVGHMLMAIPFVIYFKVNKWAWTVIFFMGYCGLIYNEFFGLNLGLFNSCYQFPDIDDDIYDGNQTYGNQTDGNSTISFQTQSQAKAKRIDEDCMYPLGVDSIWKVAQNQMQFTNSLKMKIAVILGVVHMVLGLFIKLANGIKRKNNLEIFTLTIPQIIFMGATFVYMDCLILLKWSIDYSGQKSAQAPSIIATMIAVFAGFGSNNLPVFWRRERAIEHILVALVAITIPIMLLGIPLGTYLKRRKKTQRSQIMGGEQNDFQEIIEQKNLEYDPEQQRSEQMLMNIKKGVSGVYHIEQVEPIREIFVHQFIETIEYVLGTVSNTASYLRLWALSLAHGQLSQVIFNLVLKSSASGGYATIIPVMLVFPFFYLITFGVLICMDSMECFLHSLRLHWVEFQNKFFKGTGYKFQAFNFKNVIKPIKNQ